jgi:transposase
LARDIIDAVAPELAMQPLQSEFRSLGVVYGDVRQRWVVVYSPEARNRAIKTVNKLVLRNSTKESKDFDDLCKQDFACEADARKVLSEFEKELKFTFLNDLRISQLPHFNGKGRPKQGREPDFYSYRVEGSIASQLQPRHCLLQRKSCFILASNQLDCDALSCDDLIAAYKDQQKVERGFRFLKDPMFMASQLFLKSPKRIMALMMVMTLCLVVYAALEFRIRGALRENSATFPNQKGKLIKNPTVRWVFQFFSGIHVLVVDGVREFVSNLNDFHVFLLDLLGWIIGGYIWIVGEGVRNVGHSMFDACWRVLSEVFFNGALVCV